MKAKTKTNSGCVVRANNCSPRKGITQARVEEGVHPAFLLIPLPCWERSEPAPAKAGVRGVLSYLHALSFKIRTFSPWGKVFEKKRLHACTACPARCNPVPSYCCRIHTASCAIVGVIDVLEDSRRFLLEQFRSIGLRQSMVQESLDG